MLLKSIELKNIRSYLDERIEFPLGSTLLSGDVGCGKSTMLLAMDFALFGLRKGELEGGDLLRHGKDSGSVTLAFEIGGTDVGITRTLKRSKDSVVQDSGFLSINGRREEKMPVELKSKVLELFGYSQEILKKNRPIFRYTVYTPQEKMKEILFDADARLATLRKIFSVDKYGQIKANSKLLVTELRSMKRENEALSRDLEKKMAEKEEKEAERARVVVLLDDHAGEISVIDAALRERSSEFDSLRKKISEMSSVRREMSRVESELRAKSSKLPKIEKELHDVSGKMPVQDMRIDAGVLKQEMRELEMKKEVMISEHAVTNSELLRLDSVLKKGVCSFCGQAVGSQDFRKHVDEKSRICQELKKNMDFASARIAQLKDQVSEAEKVERDRKLAEEYARRKIQLQEEQEELLSEITALRGELSMLMQKTTGEEQLEKEYAGVQEEISALTNSKLDIEKSRSRCEQQLYDIDRFLKDVEIDIDEKRAAKEKVFRINELVNWFDTYFVALMDIIERRVMSAIQHSFDEFFQKWFAVIMGDQLSVRVDENFSPVMEQNSYRTEYGNLSGGEKTAVALAYRLALTKVINTMIDTIKTKDILILDEPTDGFSGEQLDRIRNVIAELQLKQIILVSHEPKIDTFVDNVIKIYKDDHVSRVV